MAFCVQGLSIPSSHHRCVVPSAALFSPPAEPRLCFHCQFRHTCIDLRGRFKLTLLPGMSLQQWNNDTTYRSLLPLSCFDRGGILKTCTEVSACGRRVLAGTWWRRCVPFMVGESCNCFVQKVLTCIYKVSFFFSSLHFILGQCRPY